MKQYKRVRGFVRNKTTGHVSFAFWQKDNKVNSVGFTHNADDKAEKRRLSHNIDPEDNSPCFVKTKVEKQQYTKYRYDKKYRSYRLHNDDKKVIASIVARDKSKKRGV